MNLRVFGLNRAAVVNLKKKGKKNIRRDEISLPTSIYRTQERILTKLGGKTRKRVEREHTTKQPLRLNQSGSPDGFVTRISIIHCEETSNGEYPRPSTWSNE